MNGDSPDPPISYWFDLLKKGDPAAMDGLWLYYAPRLMDLARNRLRWVSKIIADEDDLVASVFESLWKGTKDGRFSTLIHRNELWKMLAVITVQKAIDYARKSKAKKRDSDQKREEFVADEVRELRPTPETEAAMKDELRHLLDLLPNDDLRRLAALKMQGYLNEEVAAELHIAIRTVERRLNKVRGIWSKSLEQA